MLWNFYPVKEFETLSVRGSMQWKDDEVEAELTVLGADRRASSSGLCS